MLEVRRDSPTMGSVGVQDDPRVIATLKDGKEIVVDVSRMSRDSFRAYLERLLERDLTEESRKRILMALKASKVEEEPVLERKKGK